MSKRRLFISLNLISIICLLILVNGGTNEPNIDIKPQTYSINADETWANQTINFGAYQLAIVDGTLTIKNCTLFGGLLVWGSGVVTVINTTWFQNHTDRILLDIADTNGIEIRIINSTLISNGTRLIDLNTNSTTYIENSVLTDLKNTSQGIFTSEGNFELVIVKSNISAIIKINDGMGVSNINISDSLFDYEDIYYEAGLSFQNCSSLIFSRNTADLNTPSTFFILDCKNIKFFDNQFLFNESKRGYSNFGVPEPGQKGINIRNDDIHSKILIVNNSFENLYNAIYILSLNTTDIQIEDNYLHNITYSGIDINEGENQTIRDNVFHQCKGPAKIFRSNNTLFSNNEFNNTELQSRDTNVEIRESNNISFRENAFYGGMAIGRTMWVEKCNDTTIEGNKFLANLSDSTFSFYNDSNMVVKSNVFNNGVIRTRNISNSIVYLNQFRGRSKAYHSNSTNIKWDNGTVGNYWEDNDYVFVGNTTISPEPFIGDNTTYEGAAYDGVYDTHPLSMKYFDPSYVNPEPDPDPDPDPIDDSSKTSDTSSKISDEMTSNLGFIQVITILTIIICLRRRKKR